MTKEKYKAEAVVTSMGKMLFEMREVLHGEWKQRTSSYPPVDVLCNMIMAESLFRIMGQLDHLAEAVTDLGTSIERLETKSPDQGPGGA